MDSLLARLSSGAPPEGSTRAERMDGDSEGDTEYLLLDFEGALPPDSSALAPGSEVTLQVPPPTAPDRSRSGQAHLQHRQANVVIATALTIAR